MENLYTLEIQSDPNNLLTVEEFVNYFATEFNLSDEKIQNLLLVVTEATTNAIIHGNKLDPEKIVVISAYKENEFLKISIKDQGCGFNPDTVPDPTAPENLLKDSGRGLYLMKFYMDDVQYKISDSGTETILSIRL